MKKIILCLLVLALLMPMKVSASETITMSSAEGTIVFEVGTGKTDFGEISPGDVVSETFVITNNSENVEEIRLAGIVNEGDESFYNVMSASLNEEKAEKLEEIKTDWLVIKSGESKEFNIELEFPAEAGNEYQNKSFKALVIFECKDKEAAGDELTGIVDTSDSNAGMFYAGIMLVALSVVLLAGRKLVK